MLARPAEAITFSEVMRVTDGPLALIHCASQKFYRRCVDCTDEAACALRRIMIEARAQLVSVLDNRTLADAAALALVEALPEDTGLATGGPAAA